MKIFFVTVSNIFSRTYSNAATFYNDSGFFFFSLTYIFIWIVLNSSRYVIYQVWNWIMKNGGKKAKKEMADERYRFAKKYLINTFTTTWIKFLSKELFFLNNMLFFFFFFFFFLQIWSVHQFFTNEFVNLLVDYLTSFVSYRLNTQIFSINQFWHW